MKGIPWIAACWLAGLSAALTGWEREILLCAAAVCVAGCGRLLAGRLWMPALLCLAAFGIAAGYGHFYQAGPPSRLPERGEAVLTGVLASQPVVKGDRVRFVLRTETGERVSVAVRLAEERELVVAGKWRRGDAAILAGEFGLPRGPRNFGQFDYAAFLGKRGIHRVFAVTGAGSADIGRTDGFSFDKGLGWLETYRNRIGERIAWLYPGLQSGFMKGMLIGLDDDIDGELFNAFSRLGLTHIIAISGLHVAVVTGGWIGLLRLMRVSRETAYASAQAVIPLYMLLAGAAPSVIRACIMAMLGIFALQRGWARHAMVLVSLTAIGMTAANPLYLHDVGFQLSFAVTAGLIAGTPAVQRLLPGAWPKWLVNALAVTVTAQLVSFPLSIYYFNQYSLLSGLANFLLVPVFSLVVLPAGYLSLLVSFASMTLARWLAVIPGWLNELGFRAIAFGSGIEHAGTVWPSPPIGAMLLYYLLLAGAAAGIGKWKSAERELFPLQAAKGRRLVMLCVLGLSVWLVAVYQPGFAGKRGTVSFLDVGQGDAILIRTPKGRTILVDGGGTIRFHRPGDEWRLGPDPYEIGKDLLVPLLMKRGVRRIDLMIATHGDTDHVGGLAAVAEMLPTKRILFNGSLSDSPAMEKLVRIALERNIPLYPAGAGQTIQVDRYTRLDFLHPDTEGPVRYEEKQNAASVVFLMTMHGRRFLFTGDMDAAAERDTVRRLRQMKAPLDASGVRVGDGEREGDAPPSLLAADDPVHVLKVAHHGSKTSTTELWLNRWKPGLAVISAGEGNIYRHPSREVLERLERHRIPVLRTDLHGEIRMLVGPDRFAWTTFLPAKGGLREEDEKTVN